MKIVFHKYQGTGNDFIIIDNRNLNFKSANIKAIVQLCDRKFGIGADGLMLLESKPGYDFEVKYYNSDGSQSLCGNGSRCIVNFARELKIIKDKTIFWAIDGEHEAVIGKNKIVSLKMHDVNKVEAGFDFYFLNTGSPHYVSFVTSLKKLDVYQLGKKIRNSPRFKREGTNVNFVEIKSNTLFIRTYERGVEGETLSCGTGVTAVALAASIQTKAKNKDWYNINTKGGNLKVKFKKKKDGSFSDIWLEGPAEFVFKGEINV